MLIPSYPDAAEIKISYAEYQKTIIYRPTCDPVLAKTQSKDDCFFKEPKKTYLATHSGLPYPTQCVAYAKTLTGVYGTWGNGGRYLSDNSDPVVGAVLIFTYTHVAVITAFDGYHITYTDRNFDRRGTIRLEVHTTINDPTIWKIHNF